MTKPKGMPQPKQKSPINRKIIDTEERSADKSRSISNNSRSPQKVTKPKINMASEKRRQKTSNLFENSSEGEEELQ